MRQSGNGVLTVVGMWLFGVAINLGILAVIVYVAMHFIRKFW